MRNAWDTVKPGHNIRRGLRAVADCRPSKSSETTHRFIFVDVRTATLQKCGVKSFSGCLCQRCHEIRRELLVKFSERNVSRLSVSEAEYFRHQISPGEDSTVQRKRFHVAPESLKASFFSRPIKTSINKGT